MLQRLRAGELEGEFVDIEVEDTREGGEMIPGMGMEINVSEMLGNILPKKKKKRHVTVQEARRLLEQDEAQKLINMDEVKAKAIEAAEKHRIVFMTRSTRSPAETRAAEDPTYPGRAFSGISCRS